MTDGSSFWAVLDIVLVIISAYFGLQAENWFRKCETADLLKTISNNPKHRMRLFYSALFLGVMMATLSVVHGLKYINGIDMTPVEGPITFLLFVSIAVLTYAWYAFFKYTACCRIE
ncbi:MAG: hypothetical protein ACE5PM_08780 [Candidatus Hydrothermarchaeales archaeon]